MATWIARKEHGVMRYYNLDVAQHIDVVLDQNGGTPTQARIIFPTGAIIVSDRATLDYIMDHVKDARVIPSPTDRPRITM